MTAPPRLLLGAALLFWGGMTDHAVPGLACALLIEGAHWTRVRWDFGDRAALMAWRLSVLLLLLAMVLVVLQGARVNAMKIVFTWLPVILLPLQFVQSYGISRSMSLGAFSMVLRRRQERARKYGLPFRDVRFNFGHVFFSAALLASCLGDLASTAIYYPGLVILVAWAFVAATGRGWRGLGLSTAIALMIPAAGGIGGQKGLSTLYRYLTERATGDGSRRFDDARETKTKIGSLEELKQSPEIQWRLIPEKGPLPSLMRVASYSTYSAPAWRAAYLPADLAIVPEETGEAERRSEESKRAAKAAKEGFEPPAQITNPLNPDDPDDAFIIAPPELPELAAAVDPGLPRFRLRGSIEDNEGLLPMPGNAASLHEFTHVYEEFERNPFGTFRIKLQQPVADARILWGEDFAPELPPWEARSKNQDGEGADEEALFLPDLQIPESEAEVLKRVVDEIGLREGDLAEKVIRLQAMFLMDFRYTRYLGDLVEGRTDRSGTTALEKFLTRTKAGHCEYFATATALLLREAGVPTRYATGFAVAEIDPESGEALLRGTHAHAWCRAWDEGKSRWIDVNLTPPDWTSLDKGQMPRFQALSDWFQSTREDFLVWRDQPGNIYIVMAIFLVPFLIGFAFIGRRLWRSKSRLADQKAKAREVAGVAVTPLASLEKPARRLLGERPPGMPVALWLMQLSPRLSEPEVLEEALSLHHRLRFDPEALAPELLAELRERVTKLSRDFREARG